MFIKKVLMIVLVSVIYVINLNIPVAAEENEQDIIFSPNWMLENGYKEEIEENQEILPDLPHSLYKFPLHPHQ